MSYANTEIAVIQWGEARGIVQNSTPYAQALKTKEELDMLKKIQNEANFINKSLTTLGRIISMIGDKKNGKVSIPYRESKLTMVLQVNFIIFIILEFFKAEFKNCYDCYYMSGNTELWTD